MRSKSMHDHAFITLEKFLKPFHRAYINLYEKMTLEEFQMVPINENSKVIHIGCGPIPNTLIILAKNIPANYVGIDRNKEAVKMAREMVKKYGLDVKIEYGDALTYPIVDYDVIIVSYGVEPYEKVFDRIKRDMKEGAVVVYRKQWDFMDFIYKKGLPSGFKIVAQHKRRDLIKSYLLKKV
ncbi:MAG: class I SAM-dependent methyltransferase [Thermoplasmata archaeon]|nr:MAG: class I SAM-dependent methyltransferase [Thermoplasmata archaeon]